SGRGGQPRSVPVFGSRVNLRSVGPSSRSNATALLPIGFAGLSGWFAFSSMPVPSSNSVTENVFVTPPPVATQPSLPNSGTLIHRTLKELTLVNPSARTGKSTGAPAPPAGSKPARAGAFRGAPPLSPGTVGLLSSSPTPNVMLPSKFKKNPSPTHPAVPTGPPNTNPKPP